MVHVLKLSFILTWDSPCRSQEHNPRPTQTAALSYAGVYSARSWSPCQWRRPKLMVHQHCDRSSYFPGILQSNYVNLPLHCTVDLHIKQEKQSINFDANGHVRIKLYKDGRYLRLETGPRRRAAGFAGAGLRFGVGTALEDDWGLEEFR